MSQLHLSRYSYSSTSACQIMDAMLAADGSCMEPHVGHLLNISIARMLYSAGNPTSCQASGGMLLWLAHCNKQNYKDMCDSYRHFLVGESGGC